MTTVDQEFRELYEAEFESVFRTAYLFCGDRDLAEEATQEAFARALERWNRLRGQSWAAGWVVTTTYNVIHRRLRREAAPVEALRPICVDETDVELELEVRRAVRALPLREQQAVVLFYFADRPVEEVAQLMGCHNGTVKVHLARARQALSRTLGGKTDG